MLPNNGNIVMAARAAQDLTAKQVVIVPSDTIPQGIAALLAFNRRPTWRPTAATWNAP